MEEQHVALIEEGEDLQDFREADVGIGGPQQIYVVARGKEIVQDHQADGGSPNKQNFEIHQLGPFVKDLKQGMGQGEIGAPQRPINLIP